MIAEQELQELERERAKAEAEDEYGDMAQGMPRGGGMPAMGSTGVGPTTPSGREVHPDLRRYSNIVHVQSDDDEE